MIEINQDKVIEITTYKPFEDSKDELVTALYELLPLIHKEPLCLNYELFINKNGTITAVGSWESTRAYNFHTNMKYIEELKIKKLPVFCKSYEKEEYKSIMAPLTALSLLNEK